jgi:acyl-CoA reductase-like NAD-dependent aldehyde dehydrogenase
MSVKALALSLPAQAYQTITWRTGTNAPPSGRFAALRVRHAGGNIGKARLRPKAKGATPVCGGKADGTLRPATPLDHVTPAMNIQQDESFGPVKGIVRVNGPTVHDDVQMPFVQTTPRRYRF